MDRFLIRTNTAAVPTMSFAYPKVAKNYTNLFSQTLAVSNHNTKQDSYILENPVGSDLRIKLGDHFDRGLTIVSIIDASGKIVKKVNYQEKISVSDLSKGLYFISVSNDNKTTKLKFLKR
ncbi:MAG: T9SS type A sorting domain-containing protein [Chryseobacterium sp.]|nr:MAG: T9SS type A sorting domain-containing protein [Chryseobacterium sp.]